MHWQSFSSKLFLGIATVWVAFSFMSCDRSPAKTGKANREALADIPDDQKPVMTFDEKEFDFGSVAEGAEVTHEYTFTNSGKSDLLITNAVASCGCTVPDWPKDPIAPGEKGKIKASFNSEGRAGQVHKSITITANTKDKAEVILKGEVVAKANAADK